MKFITTIEYEKTFENGIVKKTKEDYLIEAVSIGEAENRTVEEVAPFMMGDFQLTKATKKNISEVFLSAEEAADKFFQVKMEIITLDEKSGKEKKSSYIVLVQAADFDDACKKFHEGMKGSMMDYNITSVSLTNIFDCYGIGE